MPQCTISSLGFTKCPAPPHLDFQGFLLLPTGSSDHVHDRDLPATASVLVTGRLPYVRIAAGLWQTGTADFQRDCGKRQMWRLTRRRRGPAPSGCGCVDSAPRTGAAGARQSRRCETSAVSGPAGHSLPPWPGPRLTLRTPWENTNEERSRAMK